MASKTYTDLETVIDADTMNDLDRLHYDLLSDPATTADIRTAINVEDGADVTDTANVTSAGALMDSELASVSAVKATTGTFLVADQTKLDGIEAGATADQTKADIDALGIDADTLDGIEGATLRDGSTSQAFACSNLAFPATQVPSADANTLDDYEEGTFTPTLLDDSLSAGAGQTYNAGNKGFYTKVGDSFHLTARLFMTSLGSLNTAQTARIGGMPQAAASNATYSAFAIGHATNLALSSAGDVITARLTQGASYATLYEWDSTTGVTGLPISKVSADGLVDFSVTFRA